MTQEIWFKTDIANVLRGVVMAQLEPAGTPSVEYERGVKGLAISLAVVFGMDTDITQSGEVTREVVTR